MRPTLPLALLASLVVPALTPLADAGGARDEPPFAHPAPGALALYRVVDGTGGIANATLAWSVETALVPPGEERRFPSLSLVHRDAPAGNAAPGAGSVHGPVSLLRVNPGKDYAAVEPRVAGERTAHVSAPGGDLLARATAWYEEETGGATARGQWVHSVARADPCDLGAVETLLAVAVGRGADEVVDRLEDCGIEAAWEDGALVARTEGRALRLAPAAGLPFPRAWSIEGPDGRVEATLVGTRPGDAGVPFPSAASLAVPPKLDMIPWSAQGPARGDLPDHPFREAQAALGASGEGASYFAQHADARVLFATHAWVDAPTTAAGATGAWDARIKGIPCGATPASDDTATGEWTVSWTARGGTLFAIVQRIPAPGTPHGVERPLVATRDTLSTRETGTPALLAPAPEDLARHLRDLDAFQPAGVRSIDYAFVPTAQGNDLSAAAVSRGACERDPTTGRLAYVGLSLWFADGEAVAISRTTIERAKPAALGALLPTLSPAPATEARAGLPPLTVWTGVAATGALALLAGLAFRLVPALYSRIQRGSALASEKRAALLEAVHRTPGATARELAAALGMPVNTLEHHARVLRRHGHLRRVRTAAGVAYYASEHPRAPVAHVLDRAHADEVLAALAQDGGCTQTELAERVGMRASHMSDLLRDLEAAGLIERRRDGRVVRVFRSARGEAHADA